MNSYEMYEFFGTESEYQGTSSKKTARQINSFHSKSLEKNKDIFNINLKEQIFDDFIEERKKSLDNISKNISNNSAYYRPKTIPNNSHPLNEYSKTKVNSSTYKYKKIIPPYETLSKDECSKIIANITQFLGYN